MTTASTPELSPRGHDTPGLSGECGAAGGAAQAAGSPGSRRPVRGGRAGLCFIQEQHLKRWETKNISRPGGPH